MSTDHPLNSIDLSRMPKWDFSVRVRGMELAMISPLEAPEMNEAPMPTQAELDAKIKRWPGLFVWIVRALLGSPRVRPEDLPSDGGAAHTRKLCTIIVGEHYADLIAELSHGDCVMIFATYMAAQEEWIHACTMYARELASEHLRTKNTTATPTAPESAPTNGNQVQLVPGKPYPFEATFNPLLYNEDGTLRE